MSTENEQPAESTLDKFLRFADAVQAAHAASQRPAYAETCPCGGSIEVGQGVPAAERRRARETFLGRHHRCTSPTPPTEEGPR